MLEREAFGQALRGVRLAHGLSQERLAARAGLSPGYISRLEGGSGRRPGYAALDALAHGLGLGGADDLMRALQDSGRPLEWHARLLREALAVPALAREEAIAAAVAALRSFRPEPTARELAETAAA